MPLLLLYLSFYHYNCCCCCCHCHLMSSTKCKFDMLVTFYWIQSILNRIEMKMFHFYWIDFKGKTFAKPTSQLKDAKLVLIHIWQISVYVCESGFYWYVFVCMCVYVISIKNIFSRWFILQTTQREGKWRRHQYLPFAANPITLRQRKRQCEYIFWFDISQHCFKDWQFII